MKRLLGLIILVALGFYVAWPAWTGYQIHAAIQSEDHRTLSSKIDFPSVREGLRPAASAKINAMVQGQAGGPGGLFAATAGKDIVPKMVDTSLDTLVTPENLIRMVKQAGSFGDLAGGLLSNQLGKVIAIPGLPSGSSSTPGAGSTGGFGNLGGLASNLPGGIGELAGRAGIDAAGKGLGQLGLGSGQAAPALAPSASADQDEAPALGFANIKRFGFNGPLSFEIGIAKDPAATEPDVTAEMSFKDMDWRLTAIRPKL